jgi:methionine synthase II (cobalamin-independent)
LISSYTLGIYPRSEELIEATRKNSSNLSDLFLKETKDYISLQKKAKLGYVCDPLLKWDDIFRPFSHLKSVKLAALNRVYEMNTFYRKLSFEDGVSGGGKIVKSNLMTSLLPKNRAVCLPEPYTFADRHLSSKHKRKDEFVIDLAKMLQKEALELVKAGFKLIQLVGPSIAYNINKVDLNLVKEGLNILTRDVKAKTILHFYFGDVSKKIEKLLDLPVTGLGFDTTTTPISAIKKHSFSGKALAIGMVSSYTTKVENKNNCISEINQIVAKTRPKEAFVTTNFDLEYLPKEFARKKILVLGEIASGAKDV